MDLGAVFAATSAERRILAARLDQLDDAQWATPSLCDRWDVRAVVGHLVAALDPSPLPLFAAALRNLGRMHRANDDLARRTARRPTAELVAALRQLADRRFRPPLVGARGPLTDVLVHAGDILLPLGIAHAPAGDHVRMAMDFVTEGHPVGFVPRGLLRGLQLAPGDLDGTWGRGAPVTGRGIDLVMAACGRTAVLSSLDGPGGRVLSSRLERRTR